MAATVAVAAISWEVEVARVIIIVFVSGGEGFLGCGWDTTTESSRGRGVNVLRELWRKEECDAVVVGAECWSRNHHRPILRIV